MSSVQVSTFLQTFFPLFLVLTLPHLLDYCGIGSNMAGYRTRSTLTRTLIEKMNSDSAVREEAGESSAYKVDLQAITDENIRGKFVQLSADVETREFIENSIDKSDWLFTQMYHNFAKALLGLFYTQTDINGILHRGSMFVLSREQYLLLTNSFGGGKMIDLGAGDGNPTKSLLPSFETAYATEASGPMRKILSSMGIKVLEVEDWATQGPYDLISCLNLLDRADNPLDILNQIKTNLNPQGLLLVALVLPFRPYVEYNPPPHRPSQLLGIKGKSMENQLESAVGEISSLGFQLVTWSRVPYLCEGDLSKSVYSLNDFILVFKHK